MLLFTVLETNNFIYKFQCCYFSSLVCHILQVTILSYSKLHILCSRFTNSIYNSLSFTTLIYELLISTKYKGRR